MSPTLSYLSESGTSFIKKKITDRNSDWTLLCVKHGGNISATARQQTYFEQGGGEVVVVFYQF